MNTSKIQEKLLLSRLKKKDPEAFAQVYDLYVTPIYRLIYFKVSTHQDAEDFRQQSLLSKIETKAEMKNIELVLRKMKDEYREVIILKFIEELSISEIAKILDKSKGAVRVLLHRALKVVRDLLAKD